MPTDQLSDEDIDRFFLDHSSDLTDAISDHMTSLGFQESIRTISNLS
jgi:hypothetical protein